MAKVLGVGGIFFKAADPDAVRAWYVRVLGFTIEADFGGVMFPPLSRGFTLWTPFRATSDYFDPATAPFMVNFVVDDLDGVLARATAEGAPTLGRQDEEYGRFAWLLDPTGTKIELWQPPADPAATVPDEAAASDGG